MILGVEGVSGSAFTVLNGGTVGSGNAPCCLIVNKLRNLLVAYLVFVLH